MSTNIFVYPLFDKITHNSIIFEPKTSGIILRSVRAITKDFGEVFLFNESQAINDRTSIRYETIVSSSIFIEVSHDFANELDLEKLLNIRVGLDNFKTSGSIEVTPGKLSFNKFLTLAYTVDNMKDSYMQATLGCSIADKYENTLYNFSLPISMSDDNYLIYRLKGGEKEHILPINPRESTIRILIDNLDIDEYEVSDNKIFVDIPKGVNAFVIYQPFYVENGGFTSINEDVKINSNNEIQLRDEYCETIYYNLAVDIVNTDITNTNHTPILKRLALISSQ